MSDFRTMNKSFKIRNPESEIIRVLLIEDNPGDARLVKEMLVETEPNKFNLEHVERISEGLTCLSQDSFHVILLDLSLPDSHGLEAVDRVCNVAPQLPVLVLTSLDDERLAIRAVQEGAQDYLVKGQMDGKLLIRAIRYATERKRAEREIVALQEQLFQSQKMEAVGRLAGGIAHDFNNLLTVIKGFAELSLDELSEEVSLRVNLLEVKRASEQAINLTRQLLAFGRRQIFEMEVVDLNTILQDLEKMLRRIIGEDIEMVIFLDEKLGRVKTDPAQIEQVILNLAVNARDAMPSGGILTIETANAELTEEYTRTHVSITSGSYVMLSVSDTGCGMTPEIKERIFDPFFTTKEKGKGTGLGLSTVYGIVKQSKGNIWVYSEPGKGATFKIYLPRVDESAEELRDKMEIKEVPHGVETILIAEDDKAVRNLAVQALKRQGYSVLEAHDADEVLDLCKQQKGPIHLILTDVVMPQMSGRQLVENIKQVREDFKVLYMSGYTDDAIVHHGVLEKGVNFIPKPFTIDRLARKVREVLDE